MPLPAHLIVSTDFDGTLTSPSEPGVLSPEFTHWLGLARKKSRVTWIINTGRSWEGLSAELERRNAPVWPDWVALVEREIYRVRNKSAWSHASWNDRCTRTHARLFEKTKILWQKMRADFHPIENLQLIKDIGCPLGLIAHSEKQADELEIEILKRISPYPELILIRNSIYFRFGHGDFTKGSCLREIAAQEGAGPSECFAAGDHFNDLTMLNQSSARYLCCPSNSVEKVKTQVRLEQGYVSKFAESKGVVEGLNHYFA
jgi:hydroxymethylpyrimidine pyrophosphatase-like HAD family hydrolase